MLILAILALSAAVLAAVLAFMAWRAAVSATRRAGELDVRLLAGLDGVQSAVSALGSGARDDQERLRASQSAELAQVRAELQQGTQSQQQALVSGLQQVNASLSQHFYRAQESARESTDTLVTSQGTALENLRSSQATELTALRTELQQALQEYQQRVTAAVDAMRVAADEHQQKTAEAARVATRDLAASQRTSLAELTTSVSERLTDLLTRNDAARQELAAGVKTARQEQTDSLVRMQRTQDDRLTVLTTALTSQQQQARREVTESLKTLSASNEAKLEQMRATVQEKLDATLGERLDASFKQVSERLESVHKGLGEMQTLAQGVGSLQRTLTNVKTRGAWAELQLESLLIDLLTPDQYERQCRVSPDSSELVDFAVRLPGGDAGSPLWLAIDSKFPMDVYERFQAAWEASDPEAIRTAIKALTDRVKAEALSISSKYVKPPHTTDFAVMYLPTEGLFAEVVRQPGLIHDLRTRHKIIVAGPTTLTALLGSMSMGFRTLAIQKRSSEAWDVLTLVKSEFEKSGRVWERVVKQLDTASRTATEAGVRHRSIERKLRAVETAPLEEPLAQSLAMVEATDDDSAPMLLPLQ
jgi:DNA recombination protein RmuC